MPRTLPAVPWYLAYLTLSAIGLYYMRLGPVAREAGRLFEPLATSTGPYFYPGEDVAVLKRYTGSAWIDDWLAVLVAAFLAGPLNFAAYIQVQQAYFLVSWFSVLTVWSIESVRTRNGWSAIVFTSIWSLFYQTVGGAVVVPLYFALFTRLTSRRDYWTDSRSVPTSRANTLLPATVVGYLLPTIIMYYPFSNVNTTMAAIACWQITPMATNVLWYVLSLFGKTDSRSTTSSTSTASIKTALLLSFLVCSAAHLYTVYLCRSPAFPDITFDRVFVPSDRKGMPFPDVVHYIFQVDYAVIFVGATVWAIQSVFDVQRRVDRSVSVVLGAVLVVLAAATVGPPATLSAVWYWREGHLDKADAGRKVE